MNIQLNETYDGGFVIRADGKQRAFISQNSHPGYGCDPWFFPYTMDGDPIIQGTSKQRAIDAAIKYVEAGDYNE